MAVHDPQKEGRLARELFETGLMSDTKWRKLFAAIEGSSLVVSSMIVKFIDVSEPAILEFPPSLRCPRPYMDTIEYGPVELRAIEWLEFSADIEEIADNLGLYPLERQGAGTRIIGYK